MPAGGVFEVSIGVVERGPDADLLRGLPNCNQAYTIRPEGRRRLVLAALSDPGISYAARTLCQLLEPMLTPGSVRIPLVSVTDWPDLDERGMWNFPPPEEWIPWMASMKLNYGKMATTELSSVVPGKANRARIDTALMEKARLLGFHYVPMITHLNFLHERGLYRAYPELAGKGDGALAGRYFAHKQGKQHRAPCASNPLLVDILAEWMSDIASQGALEVGCWLTERPAQCECDNCTSRGQFVLEARAFVDAWKRIRHRYPEFNIRVFLSTTTSERDYRVVAELPREVKIERALRNRNGACAAPAPGSGGQPPSGSPCFAGSMDRQLRRADQRERTGGYPRIQGSAVVAASDPGLRGSADSKAIRRGLRNDGVGHQGQGDVRVQRRGPG